MHLYIHTRHNTSTHFASIHTRTYTRTHTHIYIQIYTNIHAFIYTRHLPTCVTAARKRGRELVRRSRSKSAFFCDRQTFLC